MFPRIISHLVTQGAILGEFQNEVGLDKLQSSRFRVALLPFLEAKKEIPTKQATYWERRPLCVGEHRQQRGLFHKPVRKSRRGE